MKLSAGLLILLLGIAQPAAAQLSCVNAGAAEASSWTPWECVLEVADGAAFAGRQAYLARLRVEFTAPGAPKSVGYAAWDGTAGGKQRFVIRYLFPLAAENAPTTWTFTTLCETPATCAALAGSGQVVVRPYTGDNRLQRWGLLGRDVRLWRAESGAARRWTTLRQVAGGPFVWVADSAWAGPFLASDEDWEVYLDDRAARGVSVIQVGLAPGWAGEVDAGGRAPFTRIAGCSTRENVVPTPCDVPDPEFWRAFEAKVAAANRRGIYVLLAGMMEPRSEHPAGNGPQNYPAAAEAVAFAHWLAARFSGAFVVFSPGFDSPRIVKKGRNLQDLVGRELMRTAPRHLVTNHWATVDLAEIAGLHGESWLGIEMFQSGHNDGNLPLILRRARDMAAQVAGALPPSSPPAAAFAANLKPAINGEAVYDGGGAPKPSFSDGVARRAAYLSWLSGASGHAFGTSGIWDWGLCGRPANDPKNACRYQLPPGWRSPLEAMQQPGAASMGAFAELLASFAGSEMDSSEQSRILNQAGDAPQRPVVGRTAGGLTVYLPENAGFDLRLPSRGGELSVDVAAGRWYDPRQGVFAPLEAAQVNCRPPRYAPDRCRIANPFFRRDDPGTSDRVLVLPERTSGGLQVFAGRLAAGEPWGVLGQLLEPGKPGFYPVWSAAGVRARAPAVAAGDGGYLAVWQAEAASEAQRGIFAMRLDSGGKPAGTALRISPEGGRVALAPAAALGERGAAIVAWRGVDPVSGQGEIWARSLSAANESGAAIKIAGGAGRDAQQPRVAIGLDGQAWIAWVERETRGVGPAAVMIRRYGDAKLGGETPALRLSTVEAPQFWLLGLNAGDGGRMAAIYEARFGSQSGGAFTQAVGRDGAKAGAEISVAAPFGAAP